MAMKILIINRDMATIFGGGESFDLNATLTLQNNGHEVTILTAKPMLAPAISLPKDIRIIAFRLPHIFTPSFLFGKKPSLPPPLILGSGQKHLESRESLVVRLKISPLLHYLNRMLFDARVRLWLWWQAKPPYDIIQCCQFFSLSAWIMKRYGMPVVAWLPGPPARQQQRIIHRLIRLKRFGLFTHGTTEASLTAMGLKRGKDFVAIPPGIHPPDKKLLGNLQHRKHQRDGLHIGEGKLLGVTTARLIPLKNHVMLIDAIALAKQKGVVWHWVMLGGGETKAQLQRHIAHRKLDQHIHLIGNQPPAQVYKWLACADVFALTSHYESYSIAVLEAVAYGLPVIGTRVGYMQHLITKAGGVLVDKNDTQALAKVLVAFADKKVRQTHAGKGIALAKRHYWQHIGKQLEDFYGDLIAKS